MTHVDPPDGPLWKSDANAVLNRGKMCRRLDLKTEIGHALAMEIIRTADVVVENFRPGVMKRLGLGPDECKAVNPSVIYISLPGYASTDPEMAELRAFEGCILAGSGAFSDMGLNRVLRGIDASYSPLLQASTYSAVLGGVAVSLAIYNRDRNGVGDVIEVPLMSGLMDGLVYNSLDIAANPERYKCLREREIERRQDEGLPMHLSYDAITHLLDPFYCTYFCRDDRPFYVVAPCHAIHQRRVLQVLGIWEEMLAAGLPEGDTYADSDQWPENCVLGTYPISSPKYISLLKKGMAAAFKLRDAKEWDSIFGSMKIPGAATRTSQEWMHTDHAQASGLIIKTYDPEYGEMLQSGPVAWLQRATVPSSEAQRASARVIGMGADQRASTTQNWLSGLKVVDMANVIAGPYIGGVLARFGAEVIKVDPNKPTYDALVAVLMGVPPNRGKRSLLADLKSASGREILARLVRWADVVIVNQVPSQLRMLGVDEASLKRINPNVIMCLFTAFGGPGWGSKSDHVGYDDLVQAGTGVMARFGGGLDTPEEHAHLGTIDVVSGFSGALAVCLALVKRRRTGRCDIANSSLAANGQLIQIQFMIDYKGKVPVKEPSGPLAKGENALYRWYEGGDEWFFLAVPNVQERHGALNSIHNALTALHDEGSKPSDPASMAAKSDEELGVYLNAAFRRHPTDTVVLELRKAGVSVQRRGTMAKRRIDNVTDAKVFSLNPELSTNGRTFQFVSQKDHPIGSEVTIFAPCSIRSTSTAVHLKSPAPKYGEHSRQILLELGYTPTEVDTLVASGIVKTEWSQRYLPVGDPWSKQVHEYNDYVQACAKL